jgi:spore germination protein KC
MKKYIFITFLILLPLLLITGCWDRREINNLAIISAIAIDKAREEEKILLSIQIEKPGQLGRGGIVGGGGQSTNKPYVILSSTGKNIFEAQRLLATHTSRSLYWAHCKVLIIGKEMARVGIGSILDFFDRHYNSRRRMWLVIANGEAKDVLQITNTIEKDPAQTLNLLFRHGTSKGFYLSDMNYFLKRLSTEGVQPLAARIQIMKNNNQETAKNTEEKPTEIKLTGTSVFNEKKLIGWLDETETLGLLLILGKAQKAGFNLPCPTNKNEDIGIHTRRLNSKIVPEIHEGKIAIKIKITIEGDVVSTQCDLDLTKTSILESLNKKYAELIRKKVQITLKKAQKDYQVDFLGFGETIMRKYPHFWKKIKDNWDEIFPIIHVNIEIDANIRRTGLILESTT